MSNARAGWLRRAAIPLRLEATVQAPARGTQMAMERLGRRTALSMFQEHKRIADGAGQLLRNLDDHFHLLADRGVCKCRSPATRLTTAAASASNACGPSGSAATKWTISRRRSISETSSTQQAAASSESRSFAGPRQGRSSIAWVWLSKAGGDEPPPGRDARNGAFTLGRPNRECRGRCRGVPGWRRFPGACPAGQAAR